MVKMDPRHELGQDFDFSHLAAEHDLQPVQDLQAPTTRIVDLLDGGDELEASWHADARRLSKRAAREGTAVTISREPDEAEVSVLHGLLTDVAEHAHFRVRSPEFLARLANEFAASSGWYQGIARVDGTPIATMASARGRSRILPVRGPAPGREIQAQLRVARGHGRHAQGTRGRWLRSVDMWGVVEPDDPDADPAWKGFSDFKRTFGGTPSRHPGLYDLVTDRFWYGCVPTRAAQELRGSRPSTKLRTLIVHSP